MSIYLKLFLSFLKIGALCFGGGYGMIAMIRETVLAEGWLTEAELLSFIAVAESTPGPVAVNMSTFIGSSQAGILGSLIATFGVVLPSFIIILLIASLIHSLLKYKGVAAFLGGIRPCIVAMVLSTAITMGISTLFSARHTEAADILDPTGLIILAILILIHKAYESKKSKAPSPILMIVISAVLGMIFNLALEAII